MSKKPELIEPKKCYRLFYEYLQESDAYKLFCEEKELITSLNQLQTEKQFLLQYHKDKKERLIDIDGEIKEILGELNQLNKEITPDIRKRINEIETVWTYPIFDFEEWYENFCSSDSLIKDAIKDYTSILFQDIDRYSCLYQPEDKPISWDKFKKYLFPDYKKQRYLYLQIDLMAGSADYLSELVRKLISNKNKEVSKIPQRQFIIEPIPKGTYSKLRRRLHVYKLYKKTNDESDIIEVIENTLSRQYKFYQNKNTNTTVREFYRDIEKAENTIRRAEKGYFP